MLNRPGGGDQLRRPAIALGSKGEDLMVMGEYTQDTELVVVGAGPGGYAAAFRAADLGLEVTMVDQAPKPGGVCLMRGCIPSKTLLAAAELIEDAGAAAAMGLRFQPPTIDLDALRAYKDRAITRLADGLVHLCKKRGVQLLQARAAFENAHTLRLSGGDLARLKFKHAILATGSRPAPLPDTIIQDRGRIMDSTGALAIADIPERLLVIGGGYVGLELGTVYAALGSRVTLTVRGDRLLANIDPDLVAPLQQKLERTFAEIHFHTGIERIIEHRDHLEATFTGQGPRGPQRFDKALVAIGRFPNSSGLGLERAGVQLDARGFVTVDSRQRTSAGHIYAVGDIRGGALLAHKAMHEGKIAAEVIAGEPSAFDIRAMPAVVYTHPQVAWAGISEQDAAASGRPVKVTRYPWSASGRAVTMGAFDGLTKLLFEAETERLVGIGIVGREAEALVAEGTLAIEMGALAQDLALTIHPHPTLSETEGEAAELFLGSATHIFARKG